MATSKDFGQFAGRMRLLAKTAESNAEKLIKQAALVADQVFVTTTPVYEGRARASTQVTLDAPATQVIEPPVNGDGGASAALALAQGRSVIATFKLSSGATIFITQTTDYSRFLDQGSSAKAPRGMTRPTVEALEKFLRGRARILQGF